MVKFSLQRVLELRERREQAIAVRLAEARTRADDARRKAAEIESLRDGSRAASEREGRIARTVGSFQNASYVREQVGRQLEDAMEQVRLAEGQVQVVLSEFSEALQNRRVLERLKEKRMEATQIEVSRTDQAAMDSIALTRFFRRDASEVGGKR